mgnify:CR=1 FL=1
MIVQSWNYIEKEWNNWWICKIKIVHKASDGTIRQEITVEMFINNKKFIEYFPKLYAEATPKYFGSVGYGIAVSNTEKINVINFITDSLSVMKYDFVM